MSNPLPRLGVVLVLIVAACCAPPPQIEQTSVERVLGTLAADDMEGRGSFTPAANRAAAFIASEFADIGLETFQGDTDYLQSFPVHSTSVASVEITLDGATVAADTAVVSLSDPAIEWTQDTGVQVVAVGADDDPMATFRGRGGDPVNRVVLLHTSHADAFARLQRFMGGIRRSLDPPAGANTVVVLTEATAPVTFHIAATSRTEPAQIANVVGVIPGRRTDEIVLFSGHYDHIGVVAPVDGDAIGNGANDDASGTTAVIELARYFSARARPERTLVFAAFIAEEMGGFGSRYFASQIDPAQVVAMFNIEMIGKVSDRGVNAAWITGFERDDFGAILQQAVAGTEFEFYGDPYPTQNLFYRSDNATLARLGVPAHSISTTPIDVDPDYHKVTDEIETLDLANVTATIRAIAAGARTIIDGTATPSRIDPSTVR